MNNRISQLDSNEMFEERLEILSKELELSIKWQRPAMLVVIHDTEDVRAKSVTAVEQHIVLNFRKKIAHLYLEQEPEQKILAILHGAQNPENHVYFLHTHNYFNRENKNSFKFLDKYSNLVQENGIHTILWIAQEDAVNLAHQAPEFWNSCQRILEFEPSLNQEQILQYVLDCAWEGVRDDFGVLETNEVCENWLANYQQDYLSEEVRANLLLALGILKWRKGDFENANNILQSALKIAIKIQNVQFEAECYNAIALVKSSLGQYGEAIEAYRQAIQLIPDEFDIWNHMGNLCIKIHRNDEAIIAFRKTIEHNPEDPIAWIGLGNVYNHINYMSDAIQAFKKAATFAPSLPQPWNGLGNAYMSVGKLDEAVQAYQKSIKLDKHSITPWLGLAQLYSKYGHNREAVRAYQQALDMNPKNCSIWNELGQVYLTLGDSQEAAHSFSKAIQIDQTFGLAYRNLALACNQLGKHREAISHYTNSVEWFSKDEEKAKSWNYLGDTYRQLGEYDGAMDAYQMADLLIHSGIAATNQIFADNPQKKTLIMTGEEHHEKNNIPIQVEANDIQELQPNQSQLPDWIFPVTNPAGINVVTSTESLFANRPFPPKKSSSQANSDNRITNREQGEKTMQITLPKFKNLHLNSDWWVGTQSAESQTRSGCDPKNDLLDPQIWNNKGSTYLQSGDFEAAIQAYEKAIKVDASFNEPYNNLALILLKLGRLEEALIYSLKGQELAKTDQEKAASWNEVGLIYRGHKDYHNALAAYQKADELDPESCRGYETVEYLHSDPNPQNAKIWLEMGDMFFKAGAYHEATNVYRQATSLDPESAQCLSNLALSLVFQGQYIEAVQYYKKSIPLYRQDQDRAVVWNRLGDVYRKLNDYDNAISAYQAAIKLTDEPVSLLMRTRFSLLSNCRMDNYTNIIGGNNE